MIRIVIYGNAVPKQSTRFYRTSSGVGTYRPPKFTEWANMVKLQAVKYRQKPLLTGYLTARLTFYLPAPKKRPKSQVYPLKSDIDNLCKGVFDPLQGIIFKNDSQIVDLEAKKRYAVDNPRVEVEIEEFL